MSFIATFNALWTPSLHNNVLQTWLPFTASTQRNRWSQHGEKVQQGNFSLLHKAHDLSNGD